MSMEPPPWLAAYRAVDDLPLQRISRLLATGGGMVTRLCEGCFGITRREAVLTVTGKGQQVYDAMVPLAFDINRQLLAVLKPQDAARLDTMLERMQTCADAMASRADLPKPDRRQGSRRVMDAD